MGARPLRQYYDPVTIELDRSLTVVEPWVRHRRRLVTELEALTEEQWRASTRCAAWDVRGVVSHLVTVDGFWLSSVRAARARSEPTTFIRGFDPSTGTDAFVEPLLALPTEVILERFVDGTDALVAAVEALDGDDWDALGEAPFGHMPARVLLGHAFWDSWLHERDILLPLGLAPAVEPDDLLAVTWYTLVVGALQGGLLDDDAPVGPGPEVPIEATVAFTDMPDAPLRVTIDRGVSVRRADARFAVAGGAALDLVEGVAGRAAPDAVGVLPDDLAAQLTRAAGIL
jgi:uncharacterized protein (TIGR03083 family)